MKRNGNSSAAQTLPELPQSQHRRRHVQLHRGLDELIADFLRHNPRALPSRTTLMRLMKWSHEQTFNPETFR